MKIKKLGEMNIKQILWILLLCCAGALSAQTYRVGDLYTAPDGSQGIVFYLHPDGSGGWVVALNDASTSCKWGDAGTNVPNVVDQDPIYPQLLINDTGGYSNTQAIRDYQANDPEYAAWIVDFEHGWYLPAPGQMRVLYAQMPFITTALINANGSPLANTMYWVSAEVDDFFSWALVYGDNTGGYFYKVIKDNIAWHCHLRAVRSFSYPEYRWNTGESSASIQVSPTQSTDYTVTVATSVGSSEETLFHLDLIPSTHTDLVMTACDSFEWNGNTYTESGVFTSQFTAANGCDSLVTLVLTVIPAPEVSMTVTRDTVCAGDSVTLTAEATPFVILPTVAIGDILCTDGTIERPTNYFASGKTAMGVVFYVDDTGAHGWAVHLHDQSERVRWTSLYNDDVPGASHCDNFWQEGTIMDYAGYTNTQAIWAAGDSISYPAAHTADLPNGWYLPAIGQLDILFSEIATLNPSLQLVNGTPFPMNTAWHYWSSTQAAAENPWYAWYVASNGRVDYMNKMYDYQDSYGDVNSYVRVRSIRDF